MVSLATITVLFALIYKFLPRVRVAWSDVWVGAAVTSLLFTIGKFAIGLYLGKSEITSGFGAAGSIVLLLVWVYYSAQIFLLGAEFTWVFAHRVGSRSAHPEELASPPPLRQSADDMRSRQPSLPTTTVAVAPAVSAGSSGKPRDGLGWIAAGIALGSLLRLVDRLKGRHRRQH